MKEKVSKLSADITARLHTKGWGEALSHATYQVFANGIPRHLLGLNIFNSDDIFEEDWQLLIILDGCRVDALSEAIDRSSVSVSNFSSRTSPGGKSLDWMREIFCEENKKTLNECSYITANPHSEIVFEESNTINPRDLTYLGEVWRESWDKQAGTVRAEPVTNEAINHIRNSNAKRYIVHYMQPHFPSIPQPEMGSTISKDEIGEEWSGSIWEKLEKGKVDQNVVWDAYISNLEYVLESVAKLLNNVNINRAIISADHGNAFGEWGFYGHTATPVHSVRQVPWVTTTAKNVENYVPNGEISDQSELTVEERLESLGYK